jgi:hypothetical protein
MPETRIEDQHNKTRDQPYFPMDPNPDRSSDSTVPARSSSTTEEEGTTVQRPS